jgi:hypothetical protein
LTPRRARWYAALAPKAPEPMTTTSAEVIMLAAYRWPGVSRPVAARTVGGPRRSNPGPPFPVAFRNDVLRQRPSPTSRQHRLAESTLSWCI